MADHPLRSATDRRLGGPLPRQPANQTQAHPLPINLWPSSHVGKRRYEVLIIVSNGYPSVRGRLPTRYSPVRRFPRIPSSEESVIRFSLDLHVLGTPPAFILSQDQTLNDNGISSISASYHFKFRTLLRFAIFLSKLLFLRNCREPFGSYQIFGCCFDLISTL